MTFPRVGRFDFAAQNTLTRRLPELLQRCAQSLHGAVQLRERASFGSGRQTVNPDRMQTNSPIASGDGGTQMLDTAMVVATIPVTDLERAKRFYSETLGLGFLWENPASVRLACGGGTQVSIFRRGPSSADHTLAHFEVSDIEAIVRDLEGRGVTFLDYAEGPMQTTGHIAQLGPARTAWFHDPDGNTLGLRQA
jgi:catechol 2,3-dioxygenase-like lactoylglutathione lyase family enzyme